jgi:uncharacterized protein with PIN domain
VIVDSSAVLAILLREAGWRPLLETIVEGDASGAVVAREPLLCVGDDFAQTDLVLVSVSP